MLRDGREVQWGSADESDLKATVLAELLAGQEAKVYDVSVPGQPARRAREIVRRIGALRRVCRVGRTGVPTVMTNARLT